MTVHLPAVAFQAQANVREDAVRLLRELAEAYRVLSRKVRTGKIAFSVDAGCSHTVVLSGEPLVKTLNLLGDPSLTRFLFSFLVNREPAVESPELDARWHWPGQTGAKGVETRLREHTAVEVRDGGAWLLSRLRDVAPESAAGFLEVSRDRFQVPVCWDGPSAEAWLPKYEPHDQKHKFEPDADVRDSKYVAPMDLTVERAQEALDGSTLVGRRRYLVQGDVCYVFHAHRPDASPQAFHGFKVAVAHLSDGLLAALNRRAPQ